MRVTLRKHGGQAAAIYLGLPPLVIDSNRLRPEEKAELETLIHAAKSARGNERELGPSGADLMSYTISIEDENGKTDLFQMQHDMEPGFKALRDWVEAHK